MDWSRFLSSILLRFFLLLFYRFFPFTHLFQGLLAISIIVVLFLLIRRLLHKRQMVGRLLRLGIRTKPSLRVFYFFIGGGCLILFLYSLAKIAVAPSIISEEDQLRLECWGEGSEGVVVNVKVNVLGPSRIILWFVNAIIMWVQQSFFFGRS